jgi:transcriptional regulator with XRE-family HTH domain
MTTDTQGFVPQAPQPASRIEILRAKKLGVLIRDARLAVGKSPADCARAIGVDVGRFETYELGEAAPSLPELELLAYFLDTPLEHFWGRNILSGKEKPGKQVDPRQLVTIRQRMIGVLLRQARLDAGLSIESLAQSAHLSPDELRRYELSEAPLPVPVLEALAGVLNRSLRDFHDRSGPVGVWSSQKHAVKDFLELPAELQAFVSKPINRPYLELAQRLSEMSVDKLRAVAEGLLEITL